MPNVYVDSNAAGAGTGADWANAFTTLAAALTASAAGDSLWVAHNHAETQATTITLTSPGTAATPSFVYCVNSAGSVPPVSADLRTTATITTTSTGDLNIGAGHTYYYGITFSCGTSGVRTLALNKGNLSWQSYKNCNFKFGAGLSGSPVLTIGQNGATSNAVDWYNCTFTATTTGAFIAVNECRFTWRSTASAIGGATFSTTLFGSSSPTGGTASLIGVDLSALGSGKTLVGAIGCPQIYTLQDCQFGSSVTVAATPTNIGGATTYVIRSDSGNTNYNHQKYHYTGTQTVETTIVRTGGATDGTTPISWKIVTSANSKWVLPFEAIPITIWNNTVSASTFTVTMFGIWGGGAVPNNDDIWFDVEGLGTASFPLGTITTTSKADNLAAGSPLTTDGTSVWGGSTTAFKIVSGAITMQSKGYLNIYVRAAKASNTFYIDPLVVLT